jgi:hypothetical protein
VQCQGGQPLKSSQARNIIPSSGEAAAILLIDLTEVNSYHPLRPGAP